MQCERPISLSIEGASGLSVVKYSREGVVHRRPFMGRSSALVPCGKCFACKARRKSQATFRMDAERRYGHVVKHKDGTSEVVRFRHSFFITLTYAEEFVPYDWKYVDRRTGEEITLLERQDTPVLFPYHLQLFFKRLRRYYKVPFVYYAVGEYGSEQNTLRPHFHMIFYSDMDWKQTVDAFRHCWSVECPKSRVGSPGTFTVVNRYETHRLGLGRVDVKSVNMRRIRYCAKYIVKADNDSHLVPKFARLSHGLGSGFLESDQARMTRSASALYAFSVDGKKCSLGRYYTHRLYTKDELSKLVDDFLFDEFAPDDLTPGTLESENWYRTKILDDTVNYRIWKANQKNPLLVYM